MKEKILSLVLTQRVKPGITLNEVAERIFGEGESYIEKGLTTVEQELELVSGIEIHLDENCYISADRCAEISGQVYDMAGFAHYWKG